MQPIVCIAMVYCCEVSMHKGGAWVFGHMVGSGADIMSCVPLCDLKFAYLVRHLCNSFFAGSFTRFQISSGVNCGYAPISHFPHMCSVIDPRCNVMIEPLLSIHLLFRYLVCGGVDRRCDLMIHTANELTAQHHRYLLSPVSVGLRSLPAPSLQDAHTDMASGHTANASTSTGFTSRTASHYQAGTSSAMYGTR
jgi:hypothetical protein